MKRSVAIYSACGGFFLTAGCTHAITPEPVRGATLRVNDRAGVGAVGDDRLSLAEAIRLANGGLAPNPVGGGVPPFAARCERAAERETW